MSGPSASTVQPQHLECALRSALGGIGHLIDHPHFCLAVGDPDAGLDFRTSALLVATLVKHLGVDAAVELGDA